MTNKHRILFGCVPERKKLAPVYDNHRKAQDEMTAIFKQSFIPDEVESYKVTLLRPIRKIFPKEMYDGFTVCGLPVSEVGCGIMCTVEAVISNAEEEFGASALIRAAVETIENNEYYYPGRGLWWHWFDNFCSRLSHWYDIVEAVKWGNPVTVLIKKPENTRNLFVNIIGTDYREGQVWFSTSDGGEISLEQLMEMIVTAPWKWYE